MSGRQDVFANAGVQASENVLNGAIPSQLGVQGWAEDAAEPGDHGPSAGTKHPRIPAKQSLEDDCRRLIGIDPLAQEPRLSVEQRAGRWVLVHALPDHVGVDHREVRRGDADSVSRELDPQPTTELLD